MANRLPLEVECLADGSLDCDLSTGEVFSVRKGVPRPMAIYPDKDGYLCFSLRRECKPPRGKPEAIPGKKRRTRFRLRRWVRVNRLIKTKAVAVAKGGRNWRQFLTPLPSGVDVNHIDLRRDNNVADNLELSTEAANRSRREMTDQEYEELLATW
jgi:hypothetical protein